MKYVCDLCGWVYDEAVGDPDHGIAPGTKFADLPEDFECPLCGGSGMIRFSDKTQKITFDFDCWANGVHLISLQYM